MELVTLIAVLVLLALNGLFVAAEFAIVGAPRTAIDQQAAKGNLRAALVSKTLADPRRQDRYITTAQLGITAASLGLGMVGEQRLAAWLQEALGATDLGGALPSHALASVIAIGALTYFHIVLGEMVPKAVALARAERAALWLMPFMQGVQWATYPLVLVLNGIANAALRLFGVERRDAAGSAHVYTAGELHHIVEESEQGGLLGSEEAQVFNRLLEFNQLVAREVMVPRVRITGLEIRSSHADLLAALGEEPHTRYPVYAHDLDHIVGMVHIKTIVRALSEERGLRQTDIQPIPFVPVSVTLDTVHRAMREARVQMAVVMDEHGGTDGILTTEDIFEEVVGEIEDEGDGGHLPITAEEPGLLRVTGTLRVDELGEHVGVELEHEEVDTVSGLVLDLLDRPPEVGDRVSYRGFGFEVTGVSGHGVTECRVELPAEAAATESE